MSAGTIVFDKKSGKDILEMLDKDVDSQGFIVEKATREKVMTQEAEEIKIDEFAGIRKGSQIFIKSDIDSIIKLIKEE